MDEKRPSKVLSLLFILLTIWYTLPKHQRQELLMRGTISGQKLTESLARTLGRVGIQDELAGRERAAQSSYDAAYNLMTGPRERLGRLYDKLRGA